MVLETFYNFLPQSSCSKSVTYMEHVEDKSSGFQQQIICLPREPIEGASSSALDSTSLGTKGLFVENGGQESLDRDQRSPDVVSEASVSVAVPDPSLLSFLLVPPPHEEGSSGDVLNGLSQTTDQALLDEPPSTKTLGEPSGPYDHTRKPRKSYPVEFKLKAIEYFHNGHTRAATAKVFGVHRKRVQEWINQEFKIKGSPMGRKRLTRRLMDKIKKDADSSNLSGQLLADCSGVEVMPEAICNTHCFAVAETCAGTLLSPGSTRSHPVATVTAQANHHPLGRLTSTGHPESIATATAPPPLPTTPAKQVAAGGQQYHHLHSNPAPPQLPGNSSSGSSSSSSSGSSGCGGCSCGGGHAHTELPPSSPAGVCESQRRHNVRFLQSLGEEAVLAVLEAMNLSQYRSSFLREQVDGELLASLTAVELRELGVESSLHRLRLLKLAGGSYSAEQLLKSSSSSAVTPQY